MCSKSAAAAAAVGSAPPAVAGGDEDVTCEAAAQEGATRTCECGTPTQKKYSRKSGGGGG